MNSNVVKSEKFDHLHLVDHFTVPLKMMKYAFCFIVKAIYVFLWLFGHFEKMAWLERFG